MRRIVRLLPKNWAILALAVVILSMVGILLNINRSHGMPHVVGLSTVHMTGRVPLPSAVSGSPRNTVSTTSSQCVGNTNGKLLLVSIAEQQLWACDGLQLAYESAVTTGASAITNADDATPTGTWHIYGKHTNTTLKGCDANGCWNDRVAYWIPFDGSVGFHDASWQTFAFGGTAYITDGSHGCVHLPTTTAAWVYNWAPIGTTMTVHA